MYAAFIIDVYSRMVVGWQLSKNLYTDLALDALNMAIWQRTHTGDDLSGLIHHSDRGVQGELNRSSLHLTFVVTVDDRQGLRREFATQASFVAVC